MSVDDLLPLPLPLLPIRPEDPQIIRPNQNVNLNRAIQITEPTMKNNSKRFKKTMKNNSKETIPISQPTTAPRKESKNPRGKMNRQNDPCFLTGYRGEAYVYEMLLKENKFSKVVWNALSNNQDNPHVTAASGKTYYIKEDGLHYDLYAEDCDDKKYYFEVKSTNSDEKKVQLSNCQIELAKSLCNPDEFHYVAVVLNADKLPSVIYYRKMAYVSD